jgi:serine/threonine protein kinase
MAPEIFAGNYKGFASDMWSAGVVLYAMLFGSVPFKGTDTKLLCAQVKSGLYYINEQISESAADMLSRLLEVNPNERITALEALNHPWMGEAIKVEIFTTEEENRFIAEMGLTKEEFSEMNIDDHESLKNCSTKSLILAPFNTTIEHKHENDYEIECNNIICFNPFVKDLDKDYEKNFNNELDNGVYNQLVSGNTPHIKCNKKRRMEIRLCANSKPKEYKLVIGKHFTRCKYIVKHCIIWLPSRLHY